MRPLPYSRSLIPTLFGLVAGFGLATVLPSLAQVPRAVPAYPQTNPPYRGLDGNLYMQTAAEYRACCYQAYNLATQRLNERLEECKKDKPKLPLAVVFDLDETVLDNSGFEAGHRHRPTQGTSGCQPRPLGERLDCVAKLVVWGMDQALWPRGQGSGSAGSAIAFRDWRAVG